MTVKNKHLHNWKKLKQAIDDIRSLDGIPRTEYTTIVIDLQKLQQVEADKYMESL